MDEKPDLHMDTKAAEEMAANAVLTYLHGSDIVGEKAKQEWIARVFERVKAKELAR